MLLSIHPVTPQPRLIAQAVKCLKEGGVIVFPTDTVYALGCNSHDIKAVEKVCRIKGVDIEKAHFSFLFNDLSHISEYTRQFNTTTYKLLKKALPGPYTFILNANNKVPSKYFGDRNRNKTIGIRIPDHPIVRLLVQELGQPIISTSIHDDDKIIDYTTDPELIHEHYEHQTDMVIDGGSGGIEPSTVIDCSGEEPIVLREGMGSLDIL